MPILIYSFLLLPVLFLFVVRKPEKPLVVLVIYSIVIFLLNFFFDLLAPKVGKGYQLIYTFTEYSSFAFVLWYSITSKGFKKIILGSSVLFFAFQILYIFSGPKKLLDSVPVGVETILILVFIFYFLYEQLKLNNTTPIHRNYTFWITIGVMIYLSGTFFFYILVNHLKRSQIEPIWFVTYVFDITKNIFFCVGLLVFANNPRKDTNQLHKNVPYLDLN